MQPMSAVRRLAGAAEFRMEIVAPALGFEFPMIHYARATDALIGLSGARICPDWYGLTQRQTMRLTARSMVPRLESRSSSRTRRPSKKTMGSTHRWQLVCYAGERDDDL